MTLPPPQLAAALAYASRGWAVVPLHTPSSRGCSCRRPDCGSPGKHPRTRRGVLEASTDPAVLERWWTTWPDANVGIATGSGSAPQGLCLVVLDVDTRKSGDETLRDLLASQGSFPDTVEALTGSGGRHIFFHSTTPVQNSAELIGPGLDVRGEGGYVVAAPSLHQSGRTYGWEASSDPTDGHPVAAIPAWLLGLCTRRRTSAPTSGDPLPEQVAEGARNDTLFRLGRSLRSKGLSEAAILSALLVENQQRCHPPLDEAEVRTLSRSATSVPAGYSAEQRRRTGRSSAADDSGAPAPNPDPSSSSDASSPGSSSTPPAPAPWTNGLARSKQGEVRSTYRNIALILRHDARFGALGYNTMTESPTWEGAPLLESRAGTIREQIEESFAFAPAAEPFFAALRAIAGERSHHPVRAFLEGLTWDGEPRIRKVLGEILAPTSEFPFDEIHQQMIRAWFVSAVARVYRPGCKVDTVLVLYGAQGRRKSSFFRELADPWFIDSPIDINNKDAGLLVSAAWIYEWPEIEQIVRDRHQGALKAFIARQTDHFRPSYGRAVIGHDRCAVIVGTTNEREFLADPTGSRRFWVVPVDDVNLDRIREWREQLWAEAVEAFKHGENWWLDRSTDTARESASVIHRQSDPWEDLVATWLAGRLSNVVVTSAEVLQEAIRLDKGQWARPQEMRIGAILRAFGFESRSTWIAREKRTRREWFRVDPSAAPPPDTPPPEDDFPR